MPRQRDHGGMSDIELGEREIAMWDIKGSIDFPYPFARYVEKWSPGTLDIEAAHERLRERLDKLVEAQGTALVIENRRVDEGREVWKIWEAAATKLLKSLGVPLK